MMHSLETGDKACVKHAPEEEELMDLPAHAQAYANADFSEPNSKFVALFSEKFPAFNGQHIIDLGCGNEASGGCSSMERRPQAQPGR